jgi:hypothetical protein
VIQLDEVSVLKTQVSCQLVRDALSVHLKSPYPGEKDVVEKHYWIVQQTMKSSGAQPPWQPDRVTYDSNTGYVSLHFAQQFADRPDIKSLKVILSSPKGISDPVEISDSVSLAISPNPANPLSSADDKDSSDIYFNGSYSVIKDSDPLYAVDAFAGYMWTLSWAENTGERIDRNGCRIQGHKEHYYGKSGFYGEVTEKSATTANPDSFLNYIVYQKTLPNLAFMEKHIRTQRPNFIYRIYGAEYNRTAEELNTVTSPMVSIPWAPFQTHPNQGDAISKWPLFHVTLGAEFVRVFDSPVAPTGKWHTRGLIGSDYVSGFAPKKSGMNKITLTSSWQLRMPSAPEIFYDSKFAPIDPTTNKQDTAKTPPMLGTQPRHYIDSKVTYNYTEWSGVTFEYNYGSKPPAFNITDNTFAFGLSLTLKQASTGRASILRP